MKITAVVFDLGKVLLDYSVENTFTYWATKSGVSADHIKKSFVMDSEYKMHETGTVTIEDFYTHICNCSGMRISLQDFITGWNAMFTGLYPGTLSMLRSIDKRINKIMLSNTNQTHTVFLRQRYDQLFKFFDMVFFSNEIQKRKPDPETFSFVLNKCSLRAQETLFFDDLEENIRGADSVHINGILVTNPDFIKDGLQKYGLIS
jgi:glucose-1-phosphatase